MFCTNLLCWVFSNVVCSGAWNTSMGWYGGVGEEEGIWKRLGQRWVGSFGTVLRGFTLLSRVQKCTFGKVMEERCRAEAARPVRPTRHYSTCRRVGPVAHRTHYSAGRHLALQPPTRRRNAEAEECERS